MNLLSEALVGLVPGINVDNLYSVEEVKLFARSAAKKHMAVGRPISTGWGYHIISSIINPDSRFEEAISIIGTEESKKTIDTSKDVFSKFGDEIFVDLGAGMNPYGYILASLFKSKAYVAVEPFFYRKLSQSNFYDIRNGFFTFSVPKEKRIPHYVVPEDMLTFLERLPDKSVSVFTSAIDDEVLPNRDYKDKTMDEILRCISSKGVYVHSAFKSSMRIDNAPGFCSYRDRYFYLIDAMYRN